MLIQGKMDEFEQKWLEMLEKAKERAQREENLTLLEYFELKSANEKLRLEASKALLEMFFYAARSKSLEGFNLKFNTKSGHQFEMRQARLTGFCLDISFGIRKLTIEIGWTRTPKDGFMRQGALAYSRISHFGRPEHNKELLLLNRNEPRWFFANDLQKLFEESDAVKHLNILLQD